MSVASDLEYRSGNTFGQRYLQYARIDCKENELLNVRWTHSGQSAVSCPSVHYPTCMFYVRNYSPKFDRICYWLSALNIIKRIYFYSSTGLPQCIRRMRLGVKLLFCVKRKLIV